MEELQQAARREGLVQTNILQFANPALAPRAAVEDLKERFPGAFGLGPPPAPPSFTPEQVGAMSPAEMRKAITAHLDFEERQRSRARTEREWKRLGVKFAPTTPGGA